MRSQLPPRLRLLDDRWGLTWRIRNQIKKTSPTRSFRLQAARLKQLQFPEPVFIIGAVRSGTTSVYRLLGVHPGLSLLGREAHDCWRRYHHPRRCDWRSDVVRASDVQRGEHSFVRRWFYVRLGEGRLLEKTPENSLRIPYLLELFPDAHIIWIKRDPRAVFNSMLNGWRDSSGLFRSYYLPEHLDIPGYGPSTRWCFGLIEGWRELRTAELTAIVTEQWRQYVRGCLEGRDIVPSHQWNEVFFEDLLDDPVPVVRDLVDRLGLARDPAVLERASLLPSHPQNTMRAGGPSDWRENEADVLAMVKALRPEIAACGYDPDDLPARRRVV